MINLYLLDISKALYTRLNTLLTLILESHETHMSRQQTVVKYPTG